MSWWLLLAAGGDPSPLAQVDDLTDWTVIGLTILFFVIFLNLMRSLVFNPVLALLDERKARIAGGFEEIEKQRADLERLKTRYETELAKIENAAGETTQTAIDVGRKAAQELMETARQQYLADLAAGTQALHAELASSKEQIVNDVYQLTMNTVERVLNQPVDREAQSASIRAAIEEAMS